MRSTTKAPKNQLCIKALPSLCLFFGTLALFSTSSSQIFAAENDAPIPAIDNLTDPQAPPAAPFDPNAIKTAKPELDIGDEKKPKQRLKINDDVPEGFESIGGPTSNIVELIFNGQNLGTVDITGNDETIRFDDPTVVAYLLPDVIDTEALIELLDRSFDSNVYAICFAKEDPPGCGTVDAEPVALIYDSSQLTVNLFLAAELQNVAQLDLTRYLPRPGEKQSSIFSFNAVASDFEDQKSALDAATRGLIGYGNGFIVSELDYNSNRNRLRLRDLSMIHFYRDHELQLGAFSHNAGAGLFDIRLLGTSYSTSLKARVDLDYAFSTQLTVYLVRRSVIQLVVDDRIYSGDTYDAGNQQIDTRALPDGRYEVEIRIIDPVSGTRSETRIFTKSAQLPPLNESLYSFTAGVPLFHPDQYVLPKTEDRGVVGITWAKRNRENSAIEMGLHQLDNRLLAHSKITLLGEKVTSVVGGSIAEGGTSVFSMQSSYLQDEFSAELLLEHVSTGKNAPDSMLYEMFPNDYTQVGLSLNKSFGNTVLGLSSRYNLQKSDPFDVEASQTDDVQYSLYLRRPIFRTSGIRGFVDGRIQKDEIGERASVQFRFFFDKPNWATNVSYTTTQDDNDVRTNGLALESSWRHTTSKGRQWALSGFANQQNEDSSLGTKVKLEHPRFHAAMASEWTDASGFGSSNNNIASLSMHLGLDETGGSFGGADYADAGVIIDVQGEPLGAPYDIIINGVKLSAGNIGRSQMIGLQPFERYSIKLNPRGLLSNGLGENVYEFTLYPGNIERVTVVAKNLVLLVTELVRENGEPINNAVVEVDGNPLLVDSGIFQGELAQGDTVTVRPESGPPCQFIVPRSNGEDVLVTESALVCSGF